MRLIRTVLQGLMIGFFGALIGGMLGRTRIGFIVGFLLGTFMQDRITFGSLFRLGLYSVGLMFLFLTLPLIGFLSLAMVPLLLLLGSTFLIYYLVTGNSEFKFNWLLSGSLFGKAPQESVLGLMASIVEKTETNKRQQYQLVRRYIRRISAGQQARDLWNRFLQFREENRDPKTLAENINDQTNQDQREYLLQVLVSLVLVSSVNQEVKDFLHQVAEWFDLRREAVDRLINMGKRQESGNKRGSSRRNRRRRYRNRNQKNTQTGIREAYKILGVDPDASREEVKKAYQEKVKKYHPDRHRNQDDSDYEKAEEKMAQVNQAYQTIKDQW